jgi:hypothetical protein
VVREVLDDINKQHGVKIELSKVFLIFFCLFVISATEFGGSLDKPRNWNYGACKEGD